MDRQRLIRYAIRGLAVVAIALVVAIVGLELTENEASVDASASASEPAVIEPIAGDVMKRVTLTQSAADRLGLEREVVRRGAGRKVVPYSALLYDERGKTWVYTSPSKLTFVRAPVVVEEILGDVVVLTSGPPAGTRVATVGAAELFGTEFEVDH
jgi:hypothetical protein